MIGFNLILNFNYIGDVNIYNWNINFTNKWITMDTENNSISDKLLMMILKLHDFVAYEIQHEVSDCNNETISEQINKVYRIFNEKFNQVIKLIKGIDSKFVLEMLNLEEPAFWMYKAYKAIDLIRDLKIKKNSCEHDAEALINSMLYLCEYITRYSYQSWLTDNDREIEIREGGVIYVDATGIISGYNKFIYDNKEIISDNNSALYFFRNISNLHKCLKINLNKYRNFEKAIGCKYSVSNPYFKDTKSNSKKEESTETTLEKTDSWDDKQIYVDKWKKFKRLQITLSFEPVYFSFFVKIQGETEKKKMKGFRVKVNINEKS